MKKLIILLMLSLLAACGSNGSSAQPAPHENEPAPQVIDLSGGWKQVNSKSETSYQIAMIADGTIEVYWKNEDGNSTALYWAGTYVPPTTETIDYSWDSVNDKSRTGSALLASGDDEKTFAYKDGVISYPVSAMGVTTTVEVSRSDDVNIEVKKAVQRDNLLPLELIESGYAVKKLGDEFYIQYALVVKNPNPETAVKFPKVRLTARDADDAVLGTDDIVGGEISPGGVWHSAFLGTVTNSEPASVDFEIIPPDDRDWISPDSLDNAAEPLTIENPTKRDDKIVGEIYNPNDFDIDMVKVIVLFRDDSGKLLAGETTFTDKVTADGKLPFELSVWADNDYVTDNFEVYAYPR